MNPKPLIISVSFTDRTMSAFLSVFVLHSAAYSFVKTGCVKPVSERTTSIECVREGKQNVKKKKIGEPIDLLDLFSRPNSIEIYIFQTVGQLVRMNVIENDVSNGDGTDVGTLSQFGEIIDKEIRE